jgi:hypothetical protein
VARWSAHAEHSGANWGALVGWRGKPRDGDVLLMFIVERRWMHSETDEAYSIR